MIRNLIGILVFCSWSVIGHGQKLDWLPNSYEIVEDVGIPLDSLNKVDSFNNMQGDWYCLCNYDHGRFAGYMFGRYKNGLREGLWVQYLNHKIVREVNYREGKLNGLLLDYDQDGNLSKQLTFSNDSLNGIATFFVKNELAAMIYFSLNSYEIKYLNKKNPSLILDEYLSEINNRSSCFCRWRW